MSLQDTIFDNLSTITQEGDMKTRQLTSIFSSAFGALTVWETRFCIRKFSKVSFMVAPFGPFSSEKYLNFGGES